MTMSNRYWSRGKIFDLLRKRDEKQDLDSMCLPNKPMEKTIPQDERRKKANANRQMVPTVMHYVVTLVKAEKVCNVYSVLKVHKRVS